MTGFQPIDPNLRVNPSGTQAPRPASNQGDFARLLEGLERMRIEGESGDTPTGALQSFDDAVGAADDLHRAAMDLGRKLEVAFRRALDEG